MHACRSTPSRSARPRCAPQLKGVPFTPCFNIDKTSDATFRGSVQGMSSFAWCEFRKHGNALLMARAERGPVSLRARGVRSVEASKPEAPKGETVGKVETPKVESAKIDPPKPEPASLELRRSTE